MQQIFSLINVGLGMVLTLGHCFSFNPLTPGLSSSSTLTFCLDLSGHGQFILFKYFAVVLYHILGHTRDEISKLKETYIF